MALSQTVTCPCQGLECSRLRPGPVNLSNARSLDEVPGAEFNWFGTQSSHKSECLCVTHVEYFLVKYHS